MKVAFLIVFLSGTATAQSLPRWPYGTNVQITTMANTFSEKEEAQIETAIASWQALLPTTLSMRFVGVAFTTQSCQACVTIVRAMVPGDERGECELSYHTTVTDHGVIRIDPRASGNSFTKVVEHELGHVLGLDHRPNSIMSARLGAHRPNAGDAALLLQIYAPNISLSRYSFKRIVTVGNVVRRSTFTFNDGGQRIETDVQQTGEAAGIDGTFWVTLPVFPISMKPMAPEGWTVAWTDEANAAAGGMPWFKDPTRSGLFFPISARKGNIAVRFYDYRLFHVSVAIREL